MTKQTKRMKKEIIKDINKIENNKLQRINKNKGYFFKKTSKIDKLLMRMIKEERAHT